MKKTKKERNALKFKGRKQSVRGVIAFVLGIIELLGIITISVISSRSGGNGSLALGLSGMLLLIAALIGFILAIYSCKERDIIISVPIAALIMNGIMMLFYICLYVIGI